MTHGSLFSGIGGFDLASEWMGWENLFHCEWNEFGQKILKYYYPNAKSYGDITKTDFSIWRGRIDILTGGFPCQPFSLAGKRKGTEDERHLWPEMLRAIREIQPSWIVGENVPGLVNWDGGLVFEQVQTDLEAEGYEVIPFLIPACGINAPHRRERIWFIAHSNYKRKCDGLGQVQTENGEVSERNNNAELGNSDKFNVAHSNSRGLEGTIKERWDSEYVKRKNGSFTQETNVADTSSEQFQGGVINRSTESKREIQADSGQFSRSIRTEWEKFPTVAPIRLGNDGFSRRLERYINNEYYEKISNTSKENRIQNLPEMWQIIQQEQVWEQIRRFFSLESKEILFQTMQLYSTGWNKQRQLSPFSEDVSRGLLQKLQKHGEFRCSPQGRELEKQYSEQLGNIMPYLPYEVALATKEHEKALKQFDAKWRVESIKAGGNAIVPGVAFQIFKAIEKFNLQTQTK